MRLFFFILIFGGCSIHSYYSDSILNKIQKEKVLLLGTTGDYPPFSFKDKNGVFSGIDIEIAKALAAELSVELKIYQTSWGTLAQDLADAHFDIALSGISKTESRMKIGFMTKGYMVNGKIAVSLCENKQRFNSLTKIDKSKTKLIVNPGGTNQSFVFKNIKKANVRVFDDNTKIFAEIIEGRADVMITDLVEALYQARKNTGKLCPTLEKPLTNEVITSFMPYDRNWNGFVSKWLERFRETKGYREIVKSYL